jgi:hypothetical protein
VRSGGYAVRVQALDAGEQVLIESAELKVTYRAAGALERMVASLQGSIVATLGICMLGGLAVAGLAVLAWFIVPRRRGERNVELVLPDKARRPMASPGAARPAAAAPPPSDPRPAREAAPQPPRPAPQAPQPGPVQPPRAVPPAPQPSAAQPPRAAPPAPQPSAAQPPRAAPPAPQPPQAAPGPAPATPAVAPVATEAVARITVVAPRITVFQAEIRTPSYRIGRGPDNDGVLPVGAASGVSGRHCVIHYAGGRWTVQDESKFGTTVDGQPVTKGAPYDLRDGSILGLGPNLRMEFRIVSGPRPGAPS